MTKCDFCGKEAEVRGTHYGSGFGYVRLICEDCQRELGAELINPPRWKLPLKLWDYFTMYKGWVEFEVPDTEIDTVVLFGFDNSKPWEISKDFPYMDKFTELLLKKVDIAYFVQDGIPIGDFSKIINNNEELFKEHIKKHWVEDMQWVLEDVDSGEFAYEIIKDFDNVVGGRYEESVNKQYYELLKACK